MLDYYNFIITFSSFAVKIFDRKTESIKKDRMDLVMSRKMKIGIASFEDFKQYTLSIAKGEKTKKTDEPKIWFQSVESKVKWLKGIKDE